MFIQDLGLEKGSSIQWDLKLKQCIVGFNGNYKLGSVTCSVCLFLFLPPSMLLCSLSPSSAKSPNKLTGKSHQKVANLENSKILLNFSSPYFPSTLLEYS